MTVELNTLESAFRASITMCTKCAPSSGVAYGCSEDCWSATTQETCGRVPFSTSARIAAAMSSGVRPVTLGTEPMPLTASALPAGAFANWVK